MVANVFVNIIMCAIVTIITQMFGIYVKIFSFQIRSVIEIMFKNSGPDSDLTHWL